MTTASPFPQDFLWGVASAGHQVEGNNVNSDTLVPRAPPGKHVFRAVR